MCLWSTSMTSFSKCSPTIRALHSFPTRRSSDLRGLGLRAAVPARAQREHVVLDALGRHRADHHRDVRAQSRSEEHTSELQSQSNLVCRLLLEKKNNIVHMNPLWLLLCQQRHVAG